VNTQSTDTGEGLGARVAGRFAEVNGRHPMTVADDAYVDAYFADLAAVCRGRAQTPDGVRAEMLAGRLPLPGYLRTDGTEMVPPDYFALADEAGGVDALEKWFLAQWPDPDSAAAEWAAYLEGHYVCLKTVSPATMQRKDDLIARIRATLDTAAHETPDGLEGLHALVDELDSVLAGFAAYDRLRFGGPISRDIYVDGVRAQHPFSGRGAGDAGD
jgi:hypothetical protein